MTSVCVAELGARGDGIADIDGRRVYVPGAAPGDIAYFEDDKLVRLDPGPERAEMRCPHYGPCGGCNLQHVSDETYATWLKTPIRSALAQHGLDADILPAIVSPPQSRRRATFVARWSGGRLQVGFSAARSHHTVDLDACATISAEIVADIPAFRRFIDKDLAKKADGRAHLTQTDQGLAITLSGIDVDDVTVRLEAAALAERLPDCCSISDADGEILWQAQLPTITLSGVRVPLPSSAFLQATKDGETALINCVKTLMGDAKRIADIFSGLGTFSYALAHKARVDAFEGSGAAISAMQRAQRPKGMKSVTLHHRDLFRRPLAADELRTFEAVVIDPPRAGAKAQSTNLANANVDIIAAVSCNPATFARDARLLVDGGYSLGAIQPVGQFLWSTHVELVAGFSRR